MNVLVQAIKILHSQYPVFYLALTHVVMQADDNIQSIGITYENNQYYIKYNKKYVFRHSAEQTVFMLIHELLHILLEHFERIQGKHYIVYNYAADAIINDYIIDQYALPSPKNIVRIPRKYKGPKTTENLYWYLLQQHQKKQLNNMNFDNGINVIDNHHTQQNIRYTTHKIIQDIKNNIGAEALKNILPSETTLERHQKLLQIKQQLYRFLSHIKSRTLHVPLSSTETSKSYVRCDKRLQHILPDTVIKGLHTQKKQLNLHIILDTSGSMQIDNNFYIQQSLQLLTNLFSCVYLYYCDTEVYEQGLVILQQHLKQQYVIGGGGTQLQSAFQTILQNYKNPVIIVVTDGIMPPVDLQHKKCYIINLYFEQQPQYINDKNVKTINICITKN